MFGNISSKSSQIADSIKKSLDKIWDGLYRVRYALKDLWDEGLSLFGNFSIGALRDFYESFLKPVGTWVIGEGFPKMVNLFNDFLKNINWGVLREALNGIWTALTPFAKEVGKGLLNYWEKVLKPMSEWAMNNLIPDALELISNVIEKATPYVDDYFNIFIKLYEDVLVPLAKFLKDTFLQVWQNVSDHFGFSNDPIQVLIDSVTWLWKNVFKPLSDFLSTVFWGVIDGLIEIYNTWTGNTETVGKTTDELRKNALVDLLTFLTVDLIDSIQKLGEMFKGVMENITTLFEGLIQFLVGVFTGDWKSAWEGLKKIFSGAVGVLDVIFGTVFNSIGNIFVNIINGILSGFEKGLNWIVDKVNGFINKYNGIAIKIGLETYDTFNRFSLSRLQAFGYKAPSKPMLQYANGGIPDYGQVFIAREAGAELVGGFGSKTAVMNNDQIVDAVSTGVAQAVASVMGGASGGTIIQVKIGEDTIVEKMVSSINRQNRLTGKTVINV
jgi:hypothetical protein